MVYDADDMMDKFEEWKNEDKLARFHKKMEHKLNAKERRYSR